ncbi:MAG: hypothetical protein JOS17DRAFT_65833 [Linnemannia elongata]|nr:MAG: hypothetical protein JOS17DRAFT_65833 [Linnemannia elongata]
MVWKNKETKKRTKRKKNWPKLRIILDFVSLLHSLTHSLSLASLLSLLFLPSHYHTRATRRPSILFNRCLFPFVCSSLFFFFFVLR